MMRPMDTLTHALSGMLVARASHRTEDTFPFWVGSWAGFFAGAFPDIDFISRLFGMTAYLNFHRGFTHSVLLIPLWAILLAWLFATISRGRYHWKQFLPICLLSLSIHIFADIITAYGTEVLSPFSNLRLSIPTTFIIDFYFSGIILVAILSASFLKQHARRIALSGVIVLMVYVLMQGYWMRMAVSEAYASVPTRITLDSRVAAIPQPLSPFNWKLIIETKDNYYVRYINLYRKQIRAADKKDHLFKQIDALYTPLEENNWNIIPRFGLGSTQPLAKRVWQHDQMKSIRRFMEFPAVYRFDDYPEMQCIWFADQRFVLENIRAPFIFGACQHRESGEMKFLRLVDGEPAPLN
jgi:inner membrane protein